jgi:hypothetical protein
MPSVNVPPSRHVSRFSLCPQILLLLSSMLYFSPFLFGGTEVIEMDGLKHFQTYDERTGWVALFCLACIGVWIILLPPRAQTFRTDGPVETESFLIKLMLVPLAAYTLATPELFSYAKAESLEATDRLHTLFYNLCIIAFLFSLLTGWRKNLYLFCASIAGLGLILYIGHRSFVAIALVGGAYIFYRNASLFTIKLRYILSALGFLGFLAVYKSVYIALKIGNYGLVAERLSPDNLLTSAAMGLEPFITFKIFDFVVTYDYRLVCSNLPILPVTIIPFMDSIFDTALCSFNRQVQFKFFTGYSGGVAANIWAEFFANFGMLGIPVLVAILCLVATVLESVMRRVNSPAAVAGLIVAIVQFTFYIQRNELLTAFTFAKRALLLAAFVGLFAAAHRAYAGRTRFRRSLN